MESVVFDIGTNIGQHLIHNARKNTDTSFFAFEPNPFCYNRLIESTFDLPNVTIINKAVSDFDGKAKFNITTDIDNYSASSLLKFNDILSLNWNGVEKNFKVSKIIDVDVIRLDKFIENLNIQKIEFFHCDAQGSDLNILKGLGDKISIIKAGCVEAAIKRNVLYYNQPLVDEVRLFLQKNNFLIREIKCNDTNNNEANIHFVHKSFVVDL